MLIIVIFSTHLIYVNECAICLLLTLYLHILYSFGMNYHTMPWNDSTKIN